jgi:Zn-dependent protease/CBS domain-containing protein
MATDASKNRLSSGLRLMKIAGIQIVIDYSWFLIFILVGVSLSAGYFPHQFPKASAAAYWVAGLVATLLFFGSILVHELAHSLVAMRAGIHIPEITLFIFGGVSRLSQEAKDAKTEFRIAIVGPLTSFALALVFWGLSQLVANTQPSLPGAVLSYLVWINVAVGIFNLLPGFPLDGGRVLRAILWHRHGSLTRATRTASDVGKGFAMVLMALGALELFMGGLLGGIWLIFIGMFLRGMAEGGYQEVVMRQALSGVSVEDVMVRDVVSVPPSVALDRLLSDYFLRYGYRGFPVVQDDGKVMGVVSLDQVRDIPEADRASTTVEHAMRPLSDGHLIAPQTSLSDALQKMANEGVGRLLVIHDHTLDGMITKTGLMRFMEIKRVLE